MNNSPSPRQKCPSCFQHHQSLVSQTLYLLRALKLHLNLHSNTQSPVNAMQANEAIESLAQLIASKEGKSADQLGEPSVQPQD